jgi:PKD repeat protein
MKTIKALSSFLMIALLSFSFVSCSQDDDFEEVLANPQPAFTYEVVQDNPQLVSFINTSEDAREFIWDFGDGSENSTQKHPSHLFEDGGTYTVTLTAFNGDLSEEISEEIVVSGIPAAQFAYEADEENSYTIHFENLSSNVDQYSWDFGDGSEVSTEENPTHTYESTGTYTVTLTATGAGGTSESSMEVEVMDAQPAYSELYIVGDASPSGWNIGTPEGFTQSEENPFVFVWEGILSPGNLKLSTYTGDWCDGDWLHPAEANKSIIEATEVVAHPGCTGPDNQWVVTEETQGRYRITVNLQDNTISFDELTPEYSELYLIGDAGPNGWNIGSPEEAFTQSETDPFIFTFQAYLNPGNLKISTYTGDWCDDEWLHASQANTSVTDASEYVVFMGCDGPDDQWVVTDETQGDYLITVNLYDQTIVFDAQ